MSVQHCGVHRNANTKGCHVQIESGHPTSWKLPRYTIESLRLLWLTEYVIFVLFADAYTHQTRPHFFRYIKLVADCICQHFQMNFTCNQCDVCWRFFYAVAKVLRQVLVGVGGGRGYLVLCYVC